MAINAPKSFDIYNRSYVLKRYPTKHQKELRAWDYADLYLLDYIEKNLKSISEQKICILNDSFGALTLPLNEYAPLSYSDSWLSKEGIERNAQLNQIDAKYQFFSEIDQLVLQDTPKLIVGRVPKSSSQLAYLLSRLHHWLINSSSTSQLECQLLLAGMDKHLSRGQFDLLARYFGPTQFLPGVKKARIWLASFDPNLESHFEAISSVYEYGLRLQALPNVFSQAKLDIGSRFFLEHFSKLPACQKVADLACGYGILGLAYLKDHPNTQLFFCDESYQAIASTRMNLTENLPHAQAQTLVGDGLKAFESEQLELVLCNPPFHQQHTVSTDLAYSMFKDAYRVLKKGGELWIVANRHLAYHKFLKRLFGECQIKASNQKFVILRACKH